MMTLDDIEVLREFINKLEIYYERAESPEWCVAYIDAERAEQLLPSLKAILSNIEDVT